MWALFLKKDWKAARYLQLLLYVTIPYITWAEKVVYDVLNICCGQDEQHSIILNSFCHGKVKNAINMKWKMQKDRFLNLHGLVQYNKPVKSERHVWATSSAYESVLVSSPCGVSIVIKNNNNTVFIGHTPPICSQLWSWCVRWFI